jgi:predicted lipid-binding transport protein (Tim44 family)
MADFDWSPYRVGGATRSDALSGMNAQFRAALQGLISSAPHGIREQLQVYSGYRSPTKQAELYNRALQKYGSPQAARQWVAPPNKSQHNKGMAADLKYLSPQAKAWVRENAPVHGLSFPLKNEPWHVELATARNPNAAMPPMDIPNVAPSDVSPSLLSYDAVPTPKPQSSPFDSILAPSAPSAPTEQMAAFRATPSPVQREALPDVSPVSMKSSRLGSPPTLADMSRLGPAPAAAPASSYFDYSGLLGEDPQQPSALDARFGPTTPVATTPQQLQRGLLDQQLNAGILPDLMTPATNWPGQMAPANAPTVDQPAMGDYEPASIKTSSVQPPAVQNGLMSMPEYRQVQEQQSLLGGPMQHSTPAEFQAYADRTRQSMQNRSLGGGVLGGLLGGLTLGPIGAIAGGLLGRNVARGSFFPEAPPKNPNSKQQQTGYAGLNESGRRSYSESKQFRDAVDGKMSAGLW